MNCILMFTALSSIVAQLVLVSPQLARIPLRTESFVSVSTAASDPLGWAPSDKDNFCKSNATLNGNPVRCSTLCDASVPRWQRPALGCRSLENIFEQTTVDSVFIPLFSTFINTSNPQQSDMSIMLYVESLWLEVVISAAAQGAPDWPWSQVLAGGSQQKSSCVSAILDGQGNVWKVSAPGEPIIFPVSDLPTLTHNMPLAMSKNFESFAGGFQQDAGIFTVVTDCYNYVEDARTVCRGCGLHPSQLVGMQFDLVCLVRVLWQDVPDDNPDFKISRWRITEAGGTEVARGLNIAAGVGAGQARYWDVAACTNIFTSALVILGVPALLMRIFIMTSLGQLSVLFRRKLLTRFSITEEAGNTTARLLSHNHCFNQLAHSGRHITEEQLEDQLTQVMENSWQKKALKDREIKHMAAFCMSAVGAASAEAERDAAAEESSAGFSFGRQMTRSLSTASLSTPLEFKNIITREHFLEAHSASSAMDFDNLSKLFDGEREASFLERFFTPKDMRLCKEEISMREDALVQQEADLKESGKTAVTECVPATPNSESLAELRKELESLALRQAADSERIKSLEDERALATAGSTLSQPTDKVSEDSLAVKTWQSRDRMAQGSLQQLLAAEHAASVAVERLQGQVVEASQALQSIRADQAHVVKCLEDCRACTAEAESLKSLQLKRTEAASAAEGLTSSHQRGTLSGLTDKLEASRSLEACQACVAEARRMLEEVRRGSGLKADAGAGGAASQQRTELRSVGSEEAGSAAASAAFSPHERSSSRAMREAQSVS
eukprot:TRINITY_DN61958_c0_g1_i1.p1 TRINITY_DN61958_c0_g1~~TRINITY_DN61958_c0_g1_i1.p1  ORF type:complete len:828 (-),score=142.50 TRINITY_DN61958_c0_g1_i1:40-2385(-)